MEMKKCKDNLQATRNLGYSHSSLLTRTELISIALLLLREFYPALVSERLGITSVPFWVWLPSPGVMNRTLRLLRIKNTSLAGTGEKVSYLHRTSRNFPDAENPSWFTILLSAQTRWRVHYPLRGLTCASMFLLNTCLQVTLILINFFLKFKCNIYHHEIFFAPFLSFYFFIHICLLKIQKNLNIFSTQKIRGLSLV